MKKLIGIMVVFGMIMMFGTMAFADPDAEISVEITVAPYMALLGVSQSLVMIVNDVQAPDGSPVIQDGTHQATTLFTVQGNTGFFVTLTVNLTTNSVISLPDSMSGQPWPTAVRDVNNAIGYGVSLSNQETGGGSGNWNPGTQSIVVGFAEGQSTGSVRIHTYLDSGRSDITAASGGNLARPGLYTGTVFLTLSIPPIP